MTKQELAENFSEWQAFKTKHIWELDMEVQEEVAAEIREYQDELEELGYDGIKFDAYDGLNDYDLFEDALVFLEVLDDIG